MFRLAFLLSVFYSLMTAPLCAQRNQWQPDASAYQYFSTGNNPAQFSADRLSKIELDPLRFKNNPGSIRWTLPPNSGTATLTLDVGNFDLRDYNIYLVCSRSNTTNRITSYVNTASGTRYSIGSVTRESDIGFNLPCTEWHQTGQFIAPTLTNPSQVAQLEHVVSVTFEASNSTETTVLWIDEIRIIRPRGPLAIINFNRYRDQADTSLTPYLLQKNITANIDFNYDFARTELLETYSAIPFRAIGLDRIDTLVNQYGWSCSSHGSFYDLLPFLSPQNRYRLFALDSFINKGFDARWVFAIPKDNVTPSIMKEINDYGQYRAIRRQGQNIQNLPVSDPWSLGFFRPTSAIAGPNLNGTPLLLSQMKFFVDSCIKHRGLIILDFGTIVYTPSTLYTDIETTMYSDAVGLIEYLDSLGIPFRNFEDVFGDDSSYTQSLTASDDYKVLSGIAAQGVQVVANDQIPSGSQAQISLLSQAQYGTVSVSGDSLIYTPGSTCFQTDLFSYVLSNGSLSDTAVVRIIRSKLEFAGQKTSWCSPNRYAVKAVVQGGLMPYSYLWSNGSTADSLQLNGGFTYTLTVTDQQGCPVVKSINLPNRVRPVPKVNNSVQCGPGVPTCSVVTESGTVNWYADSSFTNLLQQGGSTYNGVINATTKLFVSVNYGGCASNLVPVTVKVVKPAVTVSVESDTVACDQQLLVLRAITEPGLLYQWNRDGAPIPNVMNSTNAKLTTGVPGRYNVTVTRPEDNCVTVSGSYNFIQPDSSLIFADTALVVCPGDSLRLYTYNSNSFSYVWKRNGVVIPGAVSYAIWVKDTGFYEVNIQGPNSCALVPVAVRVDYAGCGGVYATGPLLWEQQDRRSGITTPGGLPFDAYQDLKALSSGNVIAVGTAGGVGAATGGDAVLRKHHRQSGAVLQEQYINFYAGGASDEAIKVIVSEPFMYVILTSKKVQSPFDRDIVVLKLDTSFNTIWTNTLNTSGNPDDVAVDAGLDQSGNLYVMGNTTRAATGADIVLRKLSSGGSVLFTRYYSSSGNNSDRGSAMSVEAGGICDITGYYSSSTLGSRLIALKVQNSGTQLWVKFHDMVTNAALADEGLSVSHDPATGDMFICGFGRFSSGNDDWVVLRFAGSNGTKVWTRRYAGAGNGSDRGVKVLFTNGTLYSCGTTVAAVSSVNSSNIQLRKLDPVNGNSFWTTTYNLANGPLGASEEMVNAMRVSPAGTIYLGGNSALPAASGLDYYLVVLAYQSSGALLWAHNEPVSPGSGAQGGTINALDVFSADNALYSAGYQWKDSTGNSFTSLMKFGPVSSALISEPSAIFNGSPSPSYLLYPNPAQNEIMILRFDEGPGQIEVMDMNGRIVKDMQMHTSLMAIDISGLSSGLYLLRYTGSAGTDTQRFVRE